jgi:hypothetical protein
MSRAVDSMWTVTEAGRFVMSTPNDHLAASAVMGAVQRLGGRAIVTYADLDGLADRDARQRATEAARSAVAARVAETAAERVAAARNAARGAIDPEDAFEASMGYLSDSAGDGWSVFGSHVGQPGALEFAGQDDGGLPLWEWPVRGEDSSR